MAFKTKTVMEKENNPLSKIDLLHHLLNKGTICYLPQQFDYELLVDKIMDWMLSSLNLEAQFNKNEELLFIEYKNKGGVTGTLGLAADFKLFLLIEPQKLLFDIKPSKWFENQDTKLSLSKLVSESHVDEIKVFIFQFLYLQNSTTIKFKIDTRNHFIEKISEQKKSGFAPNFHRMNNYLFSLRFRLLKKTMGN